MRLRTEHLGRVAPVIKRARIVSGPAHLGRYSSRMGVQRTLDVRSCSYPFVLEEESNPLASAPAQGRRRAVRAQSLAILHKVGCSWSARPAGVLRSGSAGPTTRPRFEPKRSTPAGRQTGEPTVSHEGCSGLDSSSIFIRGFPAPSGPAKPAHSPPRASRRADPDPRLQGPLLHAAPDLHRADPDPRLQGPLLHADPDLHRAARPDPRRADPDPLLHAASTPDPRQAVIDGD
jgi:hypothetical protein